MMSLLQLDLVSVVARCPGALCFAWSHSVPQSRAVLVSVTEGVSVFFSEWPAPC